MLDFCNHPALAPRRFVGVAALASLLCASPSRADARGETVRLSWVRGPGAELCSSEAALAGRVAARLGRDPFSDRAARSIEGLVVRKDERFSARIYVRDDRGALLGVREIEDASPTCSALDEAVTLAVALTIDPEAALQPPTPTPVEPVSPAVPNAPPSAPSPSAPSAPPSAPGAPPSIAPAAPSIAPAARPAPSRAAPARSAPAFGVATVRALLGFGLLPRSAAGVASSAEVGAGRLRATAGLVWFPEARTSDGGFGFGLAAGALGGCFDAHRAPAVRLGLCAGAMGGAIHAVTYEVAPTNPGDHPWAALSLAGRLEVQPVGPLTLHLGLEALAPLVRHRFLVIGRAGTVFEPPPVGAIASAGVGVTFP